VNSITQKAATHSHNIFEMNTKINYRFLIPYPKPQFNVMESLKVSNSQFDKESLDRFKKILLAKRKNAEEQIRLSTENIIILHDEDDPDYMPASDIQEAGTDTQSDTMNYQLLERTRKYINQIDDALERIENGTYGICQATGKPISKGRLEAVPHTRFSIHAKNSGLDDDEI
jgi:RNA polymerase-binding protein DksA